MDRYKYNRDSPEKYNPYKQTNKTTDFTRRAFDTKLKQDLTKFNEKSEKLYEDVKESIQGLNKYYHDFGTQINSVPHNNQTIYVLETVQSFSGTIAMLEKYRALHDNISENLVWFSCKISRRAPKPKQGYAQQLYPIRDPNPERGLLGLLNAKQRHSGKRNRSELKRSRIGTRKVVCS